MEGKENLFVLYIYISRNFVDIGLGCAPPFIHDSANTEEKSLSLPLSLNTGEQAKE